jgi:hypothetical protein
VLPPAELAELVALCDGHGARLLCDEINRGVEPDPGQALPQVADLSERALSLNGLGKTYGLPGLRIGWIACRDPDLLVRLERAKHYTSICNATPSEVLARVALRARDRLLARTRARAGRPVPDRPGPAGCPGGPGRVRRFPAGGRRRRPVAGRREAVTLPFGPAGPPGRPHADQAGTAVTTRLSR